MRAIWKGSINFGLVAIPISLFPATRQDDLKFRLLRDSDHSPINYKRVAEADGKEVPWDHIVKGHEHKKGEYVVLRDEDFKRVDIEATQTVDIMNFVKLEEINPMLFHKPYYMEVGKGGDRAYSLLLDALTKSKQVGIAKVVIKTRQYLAAIKPQDTLLVLELMQFSHEIQDDGQVRTPKTRKVSPAEHKMATDLIKSMTTKWNEEDYDDEYQNALEKLIERKIAAGDKPLKKEPASKPKKTGDKDLVEMLKQSLASRKTKRKTNVPVHK